MSLNRMQFMNTYIDNTTIDEVVFQIISNIKNKKKSYVVPVNVDVIMKMENDLYLKNVVNNADIILADGQPLIWISKLYNNPIKAKISGSDLVPILCQNALENNYSVFILGGKDGVAEEARLQLQKKFIGINVVGTYSPPFGFEHDEKELKKINAIISEMEPDLLIVCFGCPKQEKWIYENYKKLNATVSVCAGATVDFLSGNIKRAPKWMSNCGLEWFYRFIHEPQRLFKRYFFDDIKILKLIWRYKKQRMCRYD